MHNKSKADVRYMVTLAMLTAILLVMSMTPLGTIPIGPLSVSFTMIPVAIAAIVLDPMSGMIMGGIFGIVSYLSCFGVGVPSAMGAVLVDIDPFLAFLQRFVPRILAGLGCGLIYSGCKKFMSSGIASFLAGFFAAFLNTVLFMLALVLLFGHTNYLQDMMGGKNVLVFICTFVGIQAVVEMIADTIIVGAIAPIILKVRGK